MIQQTNAYIAGYASHAELALAAYADLGYGRPFINTLLRVGMTPAQAEQFLDNWQPVSQDTEICTGIGTTIFEHSQDGRRCLAIRWSQPAPDEPEVGANSQSDPGRLYPYLKARVAEWIDNGALPRGSTVSGHYIGGCLAVALKHEFPEHFAAAFSFLGDKSTMVYGVPENSVLATATHTSVLDLTLLSQSKTSGQSHPTMQDIKENDMRRLAALLILLELFTGCKTLTQMEMDAEVDRLCTIDGGLKIYETVTLPPEKFNKYNWINFYDPTLHENALGPEYIWKWNDTYLQPGGDPQANPRIWRNHVQLLRRSDGKLLGESISYSRYGGDPRFLNEFYGGPSESHHSCPEKEKGDLPLLKGVFITTEYGENK